MKLKNIYLVMLLCMGLIFIAQCKVNDVVKKKKEGPIKGIYVEDIATAFTEIDSLGKTINLDDFKGKVIMLNFSAMWCSPCRSEASEIMDIYRKYKDKGFEIIQCIYQDEDGKPADNDDLLRWKKEFGINFIVISDPDKSTVKTYRVSALPTNLIIDKDFIIKYRSTGFDKDKIESVITDSL